MRAALKAECGALFVKAQKAVTARITLEKLQRKQPPIPMCAGNNTASNIMNNTVKQIVKNDGYVFLMVKR